MIQFECKRKNLPCTAPICSCPRKEVELPSERALKKISDGINIFTGGKSNLSNEQRNNLLKK